MKVFHFRPYTLHLGRYELSRGAMVLPLPRIAMEILILLVERRGDLATRQEIAARVWPGSDPEDVFQSINTAINRIRYTLRDEAANPRCVQTVIGKGYRFVAAVDEMDLVEEEGPEAPVRLQDVATRNAEPSLAGHSSTSTMTAVAPAVADHDRLEVKVLRSLLPSELKVLSCLLRGEAGGHGLPRSCSLRLRPSVCGSASPVGLRSSRPIQARPVDQ